MKKLFIIILLTGCVFSCDDRLEDLNNPKKNATEVPGDKLFANGVREMFDLMASTDVNSNVFRLYSQYWAQTTYPDESQYNMVSREIPDNFWTFAYRNALKDLDEAAKAIERDAEALAMDDAVKANQLAIINTCKAYLFTVLVDVFGSVPYTEALNEEILSPAYDAGPDVYNNVIELLDNAIASFDTGADGFPGSQDPIYQGDVEGWKKFANSWKLRMAINISEVDNAKAATMIQQALDNGVFTSNDDNASITYFSTQPNTNPVWEDLVQSGRADYVIANTIVDKMLALSDPRIVVYADPMEDGTYIGGEYGTGNSYDDNSKVGILFHQPDLEGVILDYATVQFLLAEAAEKDFTVPQTAEEHYTNGITASMEYWGVPSALIDDYLAQPEVAYATAEGDWMQKIGTQAWIALYNQGFEAWTLWRRLDFEGFNVPDGLTADDIPNRMIFPIQEATLNPSNSRAAIEMIGGSDDVQTKIFWDVR